MIKHQPNEILFIPRIKLLGSGSCCSSGTKYKEKQKVRKKNQTEYQNLNELKVKFDNLRKGNQITVDEQQQSASYSGKKSQIVMTDMQIEPNKVYKIKFKIEEPDGVEIGVLPLSEDYNLPFEQIKNSYRLELKENTLFKEQTQLKAPSNFKLQDGILKLLIDSKKEIIRFTTSKVKTSDLQIPRIGFSRNTFYVTVGLKDIQSKVQILGGKEGNL